MMQRVLLHDLLHHNAVHLLHALVNIITRRANDRFMRAAPGLRGERSVTKACCGIAQPSSRCSKMLPVMQCSCAAILLTRARKEVEEGR